MKINARLREMRLEAGFSDSDLAQRLGISRVAVYKTESGQTNPRLKTLFSWLEECGYSLSFHRKEDEFARLFSALSDRERSTVADLMRVMPDMTDSNRDMYARIFAGLVDAVRD